MSLITDAYRNCCSHRHTRETTYSLALRADENPEARTRTIHRTDPRQPYQVQNTHLTPADRDYYHGVQNRISVSHSQEFGWWFRAQSTAREYNDATEAAMVRGTSFGQDGNGHELRGRVDVLDNPSRQQQELRSSLRSEEVYLVAVPPRTRIVTETVEFPNRGCLSCIQRVLSRCWARVCCAVREDEDPAVGG